MFVVFENIIYNLYYILQKLNTHFCTDFSEYIPQLTEELSLNISVLNLITNYKKKIYEIVEKKNLLLHMDKLFERRDNEMIDKFIDRINTSDKVYLRFYWNLETLTQVMNDEFSKLLGDKYTSLNEIYLSLDDPNIDLIKRILKEFLLINLISLTRHKLLDKMSSLYEITSRRKMKKLKKELLINFSFLSKINPQLSYFIDLLCLVKLHNFEGNEVSLVYDQFGVIEEKNVYKIIPPEILLLFMTPKQITQLDILFGNDLIFNIVSFCSTFIFYLKTECIKCSIDDLCDELYNEQSIKERNYLVSCKELCNIFNFEIYNQNRDKINDLIATNLI
jgi:hypothetical protein